MIKLYDYVLSANCYKPRLLLSMLDVPHELVPVEFYPGREHESAEFKKINPLGHIPVIDDDGFILRDAHAILIYLACRFDPPRTWYPTSDPRVLGEVTSWLQFAEGTSSTASAARLCVNFGYDFDLKVVPSRSTSPVPRARPSTSGFREQEGLDWVASTPAPTVADTALFPDVALSGEGGISHEDYPAVRRWTERVQRLPGFIDMPGVLPVAPLPC